ncbi:hypothetical protein ACPCT8_09890, partial [Aeromonas media]
LIHCSIYPLLTTACLIIDPSPEGGPLDTGFEATAPWLSSTGTQVNGHFHMSGHAAHNRLSMP